MGDPAWQPVFPPGNFPGLPSLGDRIVHLFTFSKE